MTDTVWASAVDTLRTKVLMIDAADAYIPPGNSAVEQSGRYSAREHMGPAEFPDHAIEVARYGQKAPFPPVFHINHYICVSEEVADILRSFDLGLNSLNPIVLYRKDRVTKYEGEYFILGFGEYESAFLPGGAPGFKHHPNWDTYQWISNGKRTPEDGSITLNSSALAGVDLWADRSLMTILFLSERLRQALKSAKLDRYFLLSRCKIAA